MRVRIGTRGSDLALWQARYVAAALEAAGATTALVVLKTRGDLIDDVPLTGVEGKAFFTAEIERALAAGDVDLAVHSHKDLPTEATPGLAIVAVPPRAAPGERLLVRPEAHRPDAQGGALLPLSAGARVGTSAPRRAEQILALRPDLAVEALRGNVPTRVRKLREGRYDAILLAAAGLDRLALDLTGLVCIDLGSDRLTPAPAQGALALQTRADDTALIELCRGRLHDATTARAVAAERSLLRLAGGGCNLPLGACVELTPAGWRARAFLGAGHPSAEQRAPRWSAALAREPEQAVARAWTALAHGGPTGCGPLAGLSVALTGSGAGGSSFGARLATLGAEVLHEQVIAFEPVRARELSERVAGLRPGDALAVTSRQAARTLSGLAAAAGVLVCAVGPASARALERAGLPAHVVGRGGARELAEAMTLGPGARVLFPCAEEAGHDLERALSARGVEVERLVTYRTVRGPAPELAARVAVRVYMSPSSVRAAADWERAHPGRATRRFALGRTTAEALRGAGLSFEDVPGADAPDSSSAPEALIQHLARLAPPPPSGELEA